MREEGCVCVCVCVFTQARHTIGVDETGVIVDELVYAFTYCLFTCVIICER